MGQFKPMVKMETTEPSVELKLKKGGSVAHKPMKGKAESQKPVKKAMGGGLGAVAPATPPMISPRDMALESRGPAKPSLALRRKAMAMRNARKAAPVAVEAPVMKKGGKCGGGKMATGGVVKGNSGGYKTGGVVNGQGGFKDGGSTGDVKLGNAGGFKKGGATKKFASGGSVDDSGRAQKMPQGNKKPSAPVAINMLSGTFKKGGNVSAKALQSKFKSENAPAMKAAKANSDEKYSPYQKKTGGKVKKMADGGMTYDESFASPAEQLAEMRRMKNIAKGEGAISDAEREAAKGLGVADKLKGVYNKVKGALSGQGAVTDTERTISRTVTPPAKKRGGRC